MWVAGHILGWRDKRVLRTALARAESVLQGNVLAIIVQDPAGIYVSFRPGVEKVVAEHLEGINWHGLRLLAEEHCS